MPDICRCTSNIDHGGIVESSLTKNNYCMQCKLHNLSQHMLTKSGAASTVMHRQSTGKAPTVVQ